MSRKKAKVVGHTRPASFLECLRHFLTPDVLRQAHRAAGPPKRKDVRWTLHPLLLVLLLSCWAAAAEPEERFEAARAFYVARVAPGRRRPGATYAGFLAALARLPCFVLRRLACAPRGRLAQVFSPAWRVEGFVPLGCDGTRLACPRSAELERRLSQDQSSGTPPQVWVTAVVHLKLGLLWSWLIGKPDANEREHLRRLLPTLPAGALVVTDAGYQGYELATALAGAGASFLMRLSAQTLLYFTADAAAVDPSNWADGAAWWWPQEARGRGAPPLRIRLLRAWSATGKSEAWLASNVLEHDKLSPEAAGRFYRLRRENEGFFRTYKRAPGKVKLSSRTVKLVHREVEGSLLAVQLLLALGAWAVAGADADAVCSPTAVLREIRRELAGRPPRGRGCFVDRLRRGQRDRKPRHGSKVRRPWPKRKDHKPPTPPKLRAMDHALKACVDAYLRRHSNE